MICIGLNQPKNIINIGAVLRAAGCFKADLIVSSGIRYRKAPTDTMRAPVPLIDRADNLHDHIPYGCVPVAVDLVQGAQSLVDYVHPKNAFYIFGPEDGTLGPEILKYCRDKVYVPTNGCLNLAATVNIVLYDRKAKES